MNAEPPTARFSHGASTAAARLCQTLCTDSRSQIGFARMTHKRQRTFITEDFLHRIGDDGSLAHAADRLHYKKRAEIERLPGMTTWSLICEEIVDTEYNEEYYERVINELYCRGLTNAEIREMRIFGWRTAGWLNFEMMVWDWVSLDETDIQRSIVWLRRRREISRTDARAMKDYCARYVAHYSAAESNTGIRDDGSHNANGA